MVKIALQVKANLEFIEKLYTDHNNFVFFLKLKCLNCGEESDKWHSVVESETVPSKTTKSDTNFLAKCKVCSRENSMDILKDSHKVYSADDNGKFKTIVVFDCRGIEPIDFSPRSGWIVKVDGSNSVFEDVDLTESEWVEYDENIKESIGIYNMEHQFVKVK